MKHLIICREYPPAPGGGIGTYVYNISQLLAESGETVHVIGQLWKGAEKEIEEKCSERLIIHRVPFQDWSALFGPKPDPNIKSKEANSLFNSKFYPQCFSWQASLLAERLIEQEGIDIIEAQEFEAPLYYLQLRRALGLRLKNTPPCIIHLHSPMEFIVRYNEWNIGHPYFLTAKRLEDYSIAAADALLCPSRYLAQQVEAHYGLVEGRVHIIPYPMGNIQLLERNEDTWKRGTICYVGRLERRKGVIEWIKAAVAIAYEHPTAQFEFVGANVLGSDGLSGEEIIERLIPENLRSRFLFRGEQKHNSIQHFLTKARIAVVPSRWENFPYTCIEAMCSGLPVIASREGGMAEMIEDGQSGWLATKAGSEGLAEALKLALNTPSLKIAEMGYQAATEIRLLCNKQKIVESHLNFRDKIFNQGAKCSLYLPANLPWAKRPISGNAVKRIPQIGVQKGLAIVVTCYNNGQFLVECLKRIKQQTKKPVAVVIVNASSTEKQTINVLNQVQRERWQVIHQRIGGLASGKNEAIAAILNTGLNPLGFSFLRANDRLGPHFVAESETILRQCPEVGLVSCWSGSWKKTIIRPCPSFPYQWLSNDAVPFSAVRTEALLEVGKFRPMRNQGYEEWDLFNAIMAAGWVALTIPDILGSHSFDIDSRLSVKTAFAIEGGHQELLERFPELIKRDSKDIALLSKSLILNTFNGKHVSLREHLATMRMMLHKPKKSTVLVLKKMRSKIRRRVPELVLRLFSFKEQSIKPPHGHNLRENSL